MERRTFEPCERCFEIGWPVPDGTELPELMDDVTVTECPECSTTLWVRETE